MMARRCRIRSRLRMECRRHASPDSRSCLPPMRNRMLTRRGMSPARHWNRASGGLGCIACWLLPRPGQRTSWHLQRCIQSRLARGAAALLVMPPVVNNVSQPGSRAERATKNELESKAILSRIGTALPLRSCSWYTAGPGQGHRCIESCAYDSGRTGDRISWSVIGKLAESSTKNHQMGKHGTSAAYPKQQGEAHKREKG